MLRNAMPKLIIQHKKCLTSLSLIATPPMTSKEEICRVVLATGSTKLLESGNQIHLPISPNKLCATVYYTSV